MDRTGESLRNTSRTVIVITEGPVETFAGFFDREVKRLVRDILEWDLQQFKEEDSNEQS